MTTNMTKTPEVVLVTGAGSGIGRAVALALARAGHHVVASMGEPAGRNAGRSVALRQLAKRERPVIPS